MTIHKTAVRNREIFAAYQDGHTLEELAARYALSALTVQEIIRIERHRVAVSVDIFYEEARSKKTG